MKAKLMSGIIIVLLTLVTATSVLAAYTSVTGVVHNSKEDTAWTYGGTVTVYDCGDIGGSSLGSAGIAGDGTFTVSGIDSSGVDFLCIEFTFTSGSEGTPEDQWEVSPNTSETDVTLDLGTIYTDTGPNAVTFTNVAAHSPNVWLPVGIVAGVSTLAMGALIVIRKRRS